MIYSVEVKDSKLKLVDESKEKTFKQWGLKEGDLEDFICEHPEVLFEDETCILVGRHATDKNKKINDLMALDSEGNLILIELKRDASDIVSRSEALEFQAIRYCASLANLKTTEDLAKASYAAYLKKYSSDYNGQLTPQERAVKQLNEFLKKNGSDDHFNEKQRIVLVASSFDDSTLSACAWLIKNGVDLKLVSITPIETNGIKQLDVNVVMPTKDESEYFIDLVKNEDENNTSKGKVTRTSKPKMDKLMEWGIVGVGTNLFIKGHPEETARIVDDKNVEFNGEKISFHKWGCKVTGWTSICIYEWAIIVGQSETLDELREKKISELAE